MEKLNNRHVSELNCASNWNLHIRKVPRLDVCCVSRNREALDNFRYVTQCSQVVVQCQRLQIKSNPRSIAPFTFVEELYIPGIPKGIAGIIRHYLGTRTLTFKGLVRLCGETIAEQKSKTFIRCVRYRGYLLGYVTLGSLAAHCDGAILRITFNSDRSPPDDRLRSKRPGVSTQFRMQLGHQNGDSPAN